MKTGTMSAILIALALAHGCGCNGRKVERPYPAPAASELLDQVRTRYEAIRSFQSESVMDYWVGDERVKGDVYLMGKAETELRFNALNPTGGNVAVDLACSGSSYQLLDYNNDCQITGPCDGDAIASLLRVRLEPRDFFRLAVGSVPILAPASAELRWNPDDARERVVLTAPDGRIQVIEIDGRNSRWDVVSSTMRDAQGNVEWKLENKGFRELRGDDGTPLRVPGKTRFRQPAERTDLVIDWRTMRINLELDDGKFRFQIPDGLAICR